MAVEAERTHGVEIGQVIVDSGSVMVIDPCLIGDGFRAVYDKWAAKSNPPDWGVLGEGTFLRTQDGDGAYPVYAILRGGKRIGLYVAFEPLVPI